MKKEKAAVWYKQGGYESVIFTPSTPELSLQRQYQSETHRQGLKICVVEKVGQSVKSMVQRSDPFKERTCGRKYMFWL